jgi:hypothetical protein
MAVIRRNLALQGLSGRVGDLVFRVRGDTTIVSRRPSRERREGPLPEGQERSVSRFREAVAFAREARDRPAFRSLSRLLRGYSPYHLAIQDFLSEPVIEGVEDRGAGPSGTVLLVTVAERVGVRTLQAKRVEGAAEPTPEGEKKVAESEAKGPGYTTPALMFFRRDEPETSAARARRPPAAPPGQTSIPVGDPVVTREGETREPREEGGPPVSVTTWKVVVPGPGEVEITAFDYSGNRAVRRVRVGA